MTQVSVTRGAHRALLREKTRAAHDALDARVAACDIATRAGYGAYLGMNIIALRCLLGATTAHPLARPALDDMLGAAEADAHALGLKVAMLAMPAPPLDLGALYVVAGSRLGARVLKRDILARGTPELQKALSFFDMGLADRLWPTLLETLDAQAPDAMAQITDDAIATFALFSDALERSA